MAAPVGNKNAAKSRLFEQALVREIKQRDIKDGEGETLRKVAASLVDKAIDGDRQAAMDIRDTLDGKPRQQVDIGNADDEPFKTISKIELVPLTANDSSKG